MAASRRGLGQALMEQVVYDPEFGQNLTGSFMADCVKTRMQHELT